MLAPGTTRYENYGSNRCGGRRETTVLIAIIVIVAVLAMLMLLLLPRPGAGDDGPLPRDVETRLLLGEAPDVIDRETGAAHQPPEAP